MTREVLTSAESKECRGQANGKARSRLDEGAALWRPPIIELVTVALAAMAIVAAESPRSPRTSDDALT